METVLIWCGKEENWKWWPDGDCGQSGEDISGNDWRNLCSCYYCRKARTKQPCRNFKENKPVAGSALDISGDWRSSIDASSPERYHDRRRNYLGKIGWMILPAKDPPAEIETDKVSTAGAGAINMANSLYQGAKRAGERRRLMNGLYNWEKRVKWDVDGCRSSSQSQ